MRVVRTYPYLNRETLEGRSRVEDELPRCFIHSYDNTPLLDFEDDVVILEWDIAVSREDLRLFCEIASDSPDHVMVAPYKLYPPTDARLPDVGVWAHRKVINPATLQMSWITHADLTCDIFSTGMAYLPQKVMQGFAADREFNIVDKRMTDANLSIWHYRNVKEPVPICWAVNPVHLHYTWPKGEFLWS